MQNGIYHVQFSSSLGQHGEGLVVIKEGKVNGGDAGYVYLGTLETHGTNALRGQLRIQRWNPAHVSIFGPLDNFALTLAGQAANDTFTVNGGIPTQAGMNITITGRRLAEAA